MNKIGFDGLGLAHDLFPVKAFTEIIPTGSAIGVFDSANAFGPVLIKLRKVLDSGKFPVARIHAHWGGSEHRIVPMEVLENKLPKYEELARDYPTVSIMISHSCEYKEEAASKIKERVDLIRLLAPSCVPVNSVWQGPTTPSVVTERHGNIKVKAGDIVSFDGTNAYDCDIEKWKQENNNALICFLWGYRFNLRQLTKPGQTPPLPDERSAAPSPDYIKSIVRLSQPIGEPEIPLFLDDVTPIEKLLLWKSHSEDSQGSNDARANKPVFICPVNKPSLDIVTWDNKTIGKLKYGGEFNGNFHRYYSGLPGAIGKYGFEIGLKALNKSGSEWIWIKSKNKFWGPINPSFRKGYFR